MPPQTLGKRYTNTHCTSTETVYTYADGCKQAHTLKLSQRWMFRVYEECRLQIFMPRLSRCLRKGNDSLAVFTPLLHHNLLSILCFFFSLSLSLSLQHSWWISSCTQLTFDVQHTSEWLTQRNKMFQTVTEPAGNHSNVIIRLHPCMCCCCSLSFYGALGRTHLCPQS